MKASLACSGSLFFLLLVGCQGGSAETTAVAAKAAPAAKPDGAGSQPGSKKPFVGIRLELPPSMRGTKPIYDLPLKIEIDVPEVPREIAEPAAKLEAEKKAEHPAEPSK
jgi:hypothetical protein